MTKVELTKEEKKRKQNIKSLLDQALHRHGLTGQYKTWVGMVVVHIEESEVGSRRVKEITIDNVDNLKNSPVLKLNNVSKSTIFNKLESYRYNQDVLPKFGIGLVNGKFIPMPVENDETVDPNQKLHDVDQRKSEKLPEHQEEVEDIVNEQEVNEAPAGSENNENPEIPELNEPK